jgi:hypothetical protein
LLPLLQKRWSGDTSESAKYRIYFIASRKRKRCSECSKSREQYQRDKKPKKIFVNPFTPGQPSLLNEGSKSRKQATRQTPSSGKAPARKVSHQNYPTILLTRIEAKRPAGFALLL